MDDSNSDAAGGPTSDDDVESGDGAKRSTLLAEQIRHLLVENGIKQHRQVSVVADLLQVKGRTARRKLTGETVLDEDEIKKLLDHIGYEYRGLLGIERKAINRRPENAVPSDDNGPIEVTGEFMGEPTTCKVWVKKRREQALAVQGTVLLETEHGYELHKADGLGVQGNTLLIERIEIDRPYTYEGSGKSVAVIEPERAAGQAMAGALKNQGFRTMAVWTREMLTQALTDQKFDAFLIGWAPWCGPEWSPLIIVKEIRDSNPSQPIVFVTNVNSMESPSLQEALDAYVMSVVAQPASSTGITRAVLRELRRTQLERRDDTAADQLDDPLPSL